MRARGKQEINRESYMKDGQIRRGADRGRCVPPYLFFVCVGEKETYTESRGQLEGARDQREGLSEQERARERY